MTTFENDKYRLEIKQDLYPSNPREDDNLTKMVCFHSRYNLGDSNTGYKSSNYDSWDELKKDIIRKEKAVVILPIYMYDHSGITIATTPFSCRWDSGQIGFIFINGDVARENYNVKRINKKLKELITKVLLSEINVYDQYLTGDVYRYEVYNLENAESIDSCSGFFGENFWVNGMYGNIANEVVESLLPELVAWFGEKPNNQK